jgi:RecB family endonuclease NucS
MIRYWITTHWPQYQSDSSPHKRGVYLQAGHQNVGRLLAAGDKVLIYESATGKTRIEGLVDGSTRAIPLKPGRSGIVTVADLKNILTAVDPSEAHQQYTDGTEKNWAWKAETSHHVSNGFVSRIELNRVLGYAPGNVLRGFRDQHSGLKEIRKNDYDKLITIFKSGTVLDDAPAPDGEPAPPGRQREGGGEGPDHLLLKTYVAANPSSVLGEEGVETDHVEFPFPSGDQADIVLRDREGRFIGTEIEIRQTDRPDLEGMLQAVKYRHMLAVMKNVTFEECRSLLVAYKIGSELRRRCKRYEVQCIEVDREDVNRWRKEYPPWLK